MRLLPTLVFCRAPALADENDDVTLDETSQGGFLIRRVGRVLRYGLDQSGLPVVDFLCRPAGTQTGPG